MHIFIWLDFVFTFEHSICLFFFLSCKCVFKESTVHLIYLMFVFACCIQVTVILGAMQIVFQSVLVCTFKSTKFSTFCTSSDLFSTAFADENRMHK